MTDNVLSLVPLLNNVRFTLTDKKALSVYSGLFSKKRASNSRLASGGFIP